MVVVVLKAQKTKFLLIRGVEILDYTPAHLLKQEKNKFRARKNPFVLHPPHRTLF